MVCGQPLLARDGRAVLVVDEHAVSSYCGVTTQQRTQRTPEEPSGTPGRRGPAPWRALDRLTPHQQESGDPHRPHRWIEVERLSVLSRLKGVRAKESVMRPVMSLPRGVTVGRPGAATLRPWRAADHGWLR
jgi:hypothetical protein